MIILLIQFEIYLDLLARDKIILYICTRSYNNVNPKQSKTMETKIAFSPRGNKVLLRADFEVSTLNILNNEEINKIPAKAYTVMAVAEYVEDLNVGDKVKLENDYIPTLIQMPGDTQTLAAKQKVYREGKSIIGVGTVKFSEFVLVDEYSIVGVWIESPAVNN